MRTDAKRSAVFGGSLLVVGLVLGAAGVAQRMTAPAPQPDLAAPARQLQERVDQSLATAAAGLEPEAAKVASFPALASAWRMGADSATYQDLLQNEDWAAPLREHFALTSIVPPSGPSATVGPSAGDLGASAIVRRAQSTGSASGLLPSPGGGAFLAAAARFAPSNSPGPPPAGAAPVVLIAKPLDQTTLQSVAGLTGDMIGLSDGAKLMAATGPETSRRLMVSLVGSEGRGPVRLEGARVGLAWPVGEHFWLLAVSPTAAAPPAPPTSRGMWLIVLGAGLGLAGSIALASRSRSAPEIASPTGADLASKSDPGVAAGAASPGVGAPLALPTTPVLPGTQAWGTRPTELSGQAHPPTAAVATAAMPNEPREMGRYRLIERIGEGGMAEIFFAAAYGAEDFVRHFVVKRMHAHLARHREVVNQFIDEARLQAGLVHSNIVPVFDFGKAGEEYYLALEYIHGRDLGQIVQQHVAKLGRPMDVAPAFFILHEVMDALAFAHSQSAKDGTPMEIVHRDVAPGNVLVSYRGEVKLTDFGIAKSERRVSRTEVGMVKGNASFMSPEQARGEAVDRRSDIFSAGLVLFYCLTGNFLYAGENTLNQLLRAAVGPVTSQFSQIGELPAEAAEILRRALAIDPTARYASAVDFERDVAALMGERQDLAQLMETLFPAAERRDLRQDRLEIAPGS